MTNDRKHSRPINLVATSVIFAMIFCNPCVGSDGAVHNSGQKQPSQHLALSDGTVKWVQVHSPGEDKIFAFAPTVKGMAVLLKVSGNNIVVIPATPKVRPISRDDRDPIAIVRRLDPSKPYNYKSVAQNVFGVRNAKPDLQYQYSFPFQAGTQCLISQGFGKGTHARQSQDEYAVDFSLPIGSLIYSSRDGEVVGIEDSFNNRGGGYESVHFCNSIKIKHRDGSYANYAHLSYRGVFVKLGDFVRKDQLIGLSGNTGMSSGPHLHFDVSYYDAAGKSWSVPVLFEDGAGHIIKPATGILVTKFRRAALQSKLH